LFFNHIHFQRDFATLTRCLFSIFTTFFLKPEKKCSLFFSRTGILRKYCEILNNIFQAFFLSSQKHYVF